MGKVKIKPRRAGKISVGGSKGEPRKYDKVTSEVFDSDKPLVVAIAKELLGWEELPDLPKSPKGDPAGWQEGTGGTARTIKKTVVKDGKRTVVYEPAKPITSKNKDWKGENGEGSIGERRSASRLQPTLIDLFGKRVVLHSDDANRFYRPGLARRYMNEILRGKWRLNGEAVILDWFGKVHNGRHRLVGLVLAWQAWLLDREARKVELAAKKDAGGKAAANGAPRKHGLDEPGVMGSWRAGRSASKGRWSEIWPKEPFLEIVVVKGINPAYADTIDQGQKRTIGDVFYRDSRVGQMPSKMKMQLSNILAKAVQTVWRRSGGKTVSSAPHLPASEAIEFADAHPKLVEMVHAIYVMESDGDGKHITDYVSCGTAAAMYYLMATSGTDPDEYLEKGSEALDFSMEAKATKFWNAFSTKNEVPKDQLLGSVTSLLRQRLQQIPAGAGSARDEIDGTIVKAFNRWVDGTPGKVTMDEIEVSKIEDSEIEGVMVLDEEPRLGGLDVEREPAEEPKPKKVKGGGASVGGVRAADDGKAAKSSKAGKGKAKIVPKRKGSPEPKRNTGKIGKLVRLPRLGLPHPMEDAGKPDEYFEKIVKRGRQDSPTSRTGNMAGDKWGEGDQCWVVDADPAGDEPWFGTIDMLVGNHSAMVTNEADGKDWEVPLKWLSMVHPEA